MAMTCYGCLGYLVWLSKELHKELEFEWKILLDLYNSENFKGYTHFLKNKIKPLSQTNYVMMTSLLSILVAGLISSYVILIYNIRKYYYQSMKQETRRLTILFAAFNISYVCRLIYLNTRHYDKTLLED